MKDFLKICSNVVVYPFEYAAEKISWIGVKAPEPRGFPDEIFVAIMGNGIQAWEKPPSNCPSIKYIRGK